MYLFVVGPLFDFISNLIFFFRFKDFNKTKDMTREKETDVEQLCKVIYDNGEQYMDGTAAINFAALKIVRY